jgi:putative membrane protein
MNRRTILAGALAFVAARAVGTVAQSGSTTQSGNMSGQGMSGNMMSDEMIGRFSEADFKRVNEEGAAAVAAVTPTNAPLSSDDQKLMMQVAMGGMMQLEVSRIAVQKATEPDVRMLAQAEVEEQTGLSAKLKEIASAKGMTMAMTPDAKTQRMITKMQGMAAGTNFDRAYVRESGVKGHQLLDKTMSKVEQRAADPTLKALAAAAHPLVRTHLQVSRDEVGETGRRGGNMNMNGSNMNRSS